MEEDIAKAMAEFVETDIADNLPATTSTAPTTTTTTTTTDPISGSTQALDIAVSVSCNDVDTMPSWVHVQPNQTKESDSQTQSKSNT
jgi:hypothetical protein